MSLLSKDIAEFGSAIKAFKIDMVSSNDIVTFHGMKIHRSMDLNLLEDNELDLFHVLLHKSFVDKIPLIAKDWILPLHSKFVKEYEKRGKKHLSFDKLDEIGLL